MALPATERLVWHCGEHTAKPKIGVWTPIPPIPDYPNLLFSVARGSGPGQPECLGHRTAWFGLAEKQMDDNVLGLILARRRKRIKVDDKERKRAAKASKA